MSFLLFHCVSDLLCIWYSFADLNDLFLKGLASKIETTVIASRAPGTIDAYRRAFHRRKNFAGSSAEPQALPTMLLYILLLVTTFSSNSVVHAIDWAHCLARLPSPKDSPTVQTVKEAAKKINGTSLVHRKVAISQDMIRQLITCSTLRNPLELRIVCIFVLA